jgi:hypothetical protein
MHMDRLVEWGLGGETEVLGDNLPQYHFVHHKSRMTWDRTRAAAVGSRILTTWAMAQVMPSRLRKPVCLEVALQWEGFELWNPMGAQGAGSFP